MAISKHGQAIESKPLCLGKNTSVGGVTVKHQLDFGKNMENGAEEIQKLCRVLGKLIPSRLWLNRFPKLSTSTSWILSVHRRASNCAYQRFVDHQKDEWCCNANEKQTSAESFIIFHHLLSSFIIFHLHASHIRQLGVSGVSPDISSNTHHLSESIFPFPFDPFETPALKPSPNHQGVAHPRLMQRQQGPGGEQDIARRHCRHCRHCRLCSFSFSEFLRFILFCQWMSMDVNGYRPSSERAHSANHSMVWNCLKWFVTI